MAYSLFTLRKSYLLYRRARRAAQRLNKFRHFPNATARVFRVSSRFQTTRHERGMLTTEPNETVPMLALAPYGMETLLHKLRAYHAIYRPLLQCLREYKRAEKYMHGLLSDRHASPQSPWSGRWEAAIGIRCGVTQQFLSDSARDDNTFLGPQ